VQVGLAVGCIAILAAAALFGTWTSAQPHPTPHNPSPSVPAVAIASPSRTAAPSLSPAPTEQSPASPPYVWVSTEPPTPTEPPTTDEPTDPDYTYSTHGWPMTISLFDDAIVGPDGTTYVDGYPPFDATGHARIGWLQLPDGSYSEPMAFGSDGTPYVVIDDGQGGDITIWAFGSNGKPRAGWPVTAPSGSEIEPGPSGGLYVISADASNGRIILLGLDGKTRTTWPAISVPGTTCGFAVRADGSVFYAYSSTNTASDCSVHVFDATGRQLSKSPERGWDGISMAPDGTVVAWGYDMQPYSTSTVAQTRVAVMGTDGNPIAGWPVIFQGAASAPAFGPDGKLYFTILGLGTSPSTVVAIDRTGATIAGWPATLPRGYGPLLDGSSAPLPPVAGDNGTVYAEAVDAQWMGYVTAFDASGVVLPGWPYKLPQAFSDFSGGDTRIGPSSPGPLFVRPASGVGLLYLALDGRIVALGADGHLAPGWPQLMPADHADAYWVCLIAERDGGIVAIADAPGDPGAVADSAAASDSFLVWRWSQAGKPAK
jgi:hypothetical protein